MLDQIASDTESVRRFWTKVEKGAAAECWQWTGTTSTDGYGRFSFSGRHYAAHRVSFVMAGNDIPSGMVIDHLCRTRCCVNPAHLRAVTCRDNLMAAGSLAAAKTLHDSPHCIRGHLFDASNTLLSKQGRRICRACKRKRDKQHYDQQSAAGYYKGSPRENKIWQSWPSNAKSS